MFCSECGREMPDTSKFCPQCGKAVIGQVGVANTENTVEAKPQNLKSDFKQNGWLLSLSMLCPLWEIAYRIIGYCIFMLKGYDAYWTWVTESESVPMFLFSAALGGLVIAVNYCPKYFKWIYSLQYIVVYFSNLIIVCNNWFEVHIQYGSTSFERNIVDDFLRRASEIVLRNAIYFVEIFVAILIATAIKKVFLLQKTKNLKIVICYATAVALTVVIYGIFPWFMSNGLGLSIWIYNDLLPVIFASAIGCTIAYFIANRKPKRKKK